MSAIPKFEQNNVAQCWSCQRRDGWIREVVNGYYYLLPYCSVSNGVMVRVFDNPCREFKQEDAECLTF